MWHFCGSKSTKKIERIHERALRYICDDYVSSYASLLCTTGRDTLALERMRMFVMEVFKCLNGHSPLFMSEKFDVKMLPYNMRNISILELPHFNYVNHGKKSFMYFAAHLWNNLPSEFKTVNSCKAFKSKIKSWYGPNCQCNLCMLCDPPSAIL